MTWMIIILAIVSTASGNTVTSVGLSLSTGFTASGSDYTANLGQNFNVTANISYNVNAQVTVLLNTTLPYSEQISETCLRTWINGTKESCTNVSHLSPQLTFQPTTVSVLKNNVPLPATLYNIMTSGNGISFEFSHMSSVAESETIAVHFQMFSTRNVRLIGENLKFSVSGSLKGIVLTTSPERSAIMKIKGPRPALSPGLKNRNLQAGANFKLRIKYKLDSRSTEAVTFLQFYTITNPRDIEIVSPIPGSNIQLNASTITFNDSTELTVSSTERAYTYSYTVANTASLETPFTFMFVMQYRGKDTPDIDYLYTEMYSVTSETFLSHKDKIGSIPFNLTMEDTFETGFSMRIPRGTLYDFTLTCIFSSTTIWPLTMRLFTRNVTTSRTLSTWSPASGINVDLSSMTVAMQGSGRRRRRATGGTVTVTSPPISLTNPSSTGPANVAIRGNVGLDHTNNRSDPGKVTMEVQVGYGGNKYTVAYGNIEILRAKLSLTKTYTLINKTNGIPQFSVQIRLQHSAISNRDIQHPVLTDNVAGLAVTDIVTSDQNYNPLSAPKIFHTQLSYHVSNILIGHNVTLEYTAQVNDVARFTDKAENNLFVSVEYYSAVRTVNSLNYTENASACIYRGDHYKLYTLTNNWFVILTLLLGLVVGIGLVLLIWLIYLIWRRRSRAIPPPIPPYIDPDNLTELSNAKSSDSIVKTLVQEDHLQMYRDLDALDILGAATIDLDLEYEYEKMSVDANILLVNSVTTSSNLEKAKKDEILAKFHEDVIRINEENDKACTDALGHLSVNIRRKNQLQLAALWKEHQKADEEVLKNVRGNVELQYELFGLLRKQQESERKDLVQKLKLERDEQAENTRKEFNLRKRSALRDRERDLMNEVIERGELESVNSEWFIKEHARIMSRLDALHDEEVARQLGRLEERHEERRGLAKRKVIEEENMREIMDTVQSEQTTAVRRFNKAGDISLQQMEEYMNKVQEDMGRIKENLFKLRGQEERALLDRLGEKKKKLMEEKMAEQEQELQALEMRFQEAAAGTDGKLIDPTSYLDERVAFRSYQRGVLKKLEAGIDEADTEELTNNVVTLNLKDEVLTAKDRLFAEIKKDAVSKSEVNKLMLQHSDEIQTLLSQMETDRQFQKKKLQERIAERRKVIEQDSAIERREQEELRRYENRVVNHIIAAQVAISDEERDRILLEHEKNMVQMKYSLTLIRLRQKRMLEEAYVERKNKNMEELKAKQTSEMKRHEGQQTMLDSEDKEFAAVYDKHREGLLYRHAQELLLLISGRDLEGQAELDIVRRKMIQERAQALRAQEEKLAAMVSALQIAKAKEMCRIEEQQKAIGKLKMSLMDTISGRGILTEEKCRQLIQQHHEDVAKLTKKLDMQREKQHQLIRKMMKERMKEKLNPLKKEGERQLEAELSRLSPTDTFRIEIRKLIISQRQLVERGRIQQRLDHECNQVLLEAQRQFAVTNRYYLQRQELQFIAGLVRLGKFPREELLGVFLVLLPLYTRAELEDILDKIVIKPKDEKEEGQATKPQPDYVPVFQNSKLVDTASLTFTAFHGRAKFKRSKETPEEPASLVVVIDLPPVDRPATPADTLPTTKVKKKKKQKVKAAVDTDDLKL